MSSSRDLDEAERYAAAALFTLALHIIQVETGQHGEPDAAWGEPYDDGSGVDAWAAASAAAAAASAASSSSSAASAAAAGADAAAAAAAARAAFWGFDCVASGGLLERAYAHLGVPRRAWAGLKRLPDVAGVGGSERGAFGECVAGHAAQLGAAEGALVWRGGGAAAALASSSSLSDVAAAAAAAAAGSSPSPSPSSSASDLAALAAGLRMKEGGEREDRGREDPFPSLLAPLPAEPALLSLSPGAAARDDADTDSDLEADVAAEERRRVAAARAAPRSRERGGSGGARSGQGGGALCSPAIGGSANSGSIGSDGSSSVREAMSAALSSQLGEGEVAAAAGATFPAAGAPLPSPSPPSPSPPPPPQPAPAPPAAARRAPRPPPSAKAVAAICDLLEGCLATAAAEEGEGLATGGSSSSRSKGKGTTASLSSSSSSNFRNRGSGIAAPVCGWYDARARVALRRVAHWLGVPWPKVANFEHLLAFSLTLPTESGSGFGGGGGGGGGGKKSAASAPPSGDLARATSSTTTSASLVRRSAWEKGVKAAQVTGAAVGIGALFALTGGLAAPAVAAGVSAAMTAVGGASAAASAAAASAFLTTGAGTALVAGGVGAGGGAFAGSRMARRVGDVKEFGFVELAPGGGGYDGGDWTGSEEERAGGAVAGEQGDEDGSGSSSRDDDDDDAGGSSDGSDASGGDGGRRRGRRQRLRHPAVDPFLFASSAAGLAPTAAAKGPIAAATSTEDLLEMELKPLRREAAVGVDDDEGGEEEGGGGGEATRELPKAPSSSAAAAETTTGAAAASNGVDAFEALRPPSPPRMGRDEDEEEDHSSGTLPRSMSRPSLAEKASQPSLLPPLDGDGDDQRRRDERRRRRRLRRAKKKNSPKRTVVRPYRRPPLPSLLPWPASATRSPEDSRLAVTLCVGGWARRREDLVDVWRARGLLPLAESSSSSALGSSSSSLARRDAERYALVWESEALINLSDVVAAWVRNQAAQGVIKFALQHWLYAGAAAAAAGPLALVSVSQVIDSAWAMALDRAVKAGRLLAQLLLANRHGGRPVTLIGYSMGARLVFHCLLELSRAAAAGGITNDLSRAGGGNGAIVENAVLLGAPVAAHPARWAMARRAVAGRLVNGYSRSDWILGVVFRASSGFVRPAGGLCPVKVSGVENVNLGAVIKGHLDYAGNLPEILELVGIGE